MFYRNYGKVFQFNFIIIYIMYCVFQIFHFITEVVYETYILWDSNSLKGLVVCLKNTQWTICSCKSTKFMNSCFLHLINRGKNSFCFVIYTTTLHSRQYKLHICEFIKCCKVHQNKKSTSPLEEILNLASLLTKVVCSSLP